MKSIDNCVICFSMLGVEDALHVFEYHKFDDMLFLQLFDDV